MLLAFPPCPIWRKGHHGLYFLLYMTFPSSCVVELSWVAWRRQKAVNWLAGGEADPSAGQKQHPAWEERQGVEDFQEGETVSKESPGWRQQAEAPGPLASGGGEPHTGWSTEAALAPGSLAESAQEAGMADPQRQWPLSQATTQPIRLRP